MRIGLILIAMTAFASSVCAQQNIPEELRQSGHELQLATGEEAANLQFIRDKICPIQRTEEEKVLCRKDAGTGLALLAVTLLDSATARYYFSIGDKASAKIFVDSFATNSDAALKQVSSVKIKWKK